MSITKRLAAAEAELAAIKKHLQDEQVGSLLPKDWPDWCSRIVPNKDYFDAISTMILLRQQPGSEAAKDDVSQRIIGLFQGVVGTDFWFDRYNKMNQISPCFRTKEHAEAAIKAVGVERIARMFCTLHGVE
jgi:hypothetical protein